MRAPIQILGARVRFESNSRALLRLVDAAYAGLPRHRLSRTPPRLTLRLMLSAPPRRHARAEPPHLAMLSGAGYLAAATQGSNFALVSTGQRTALLAISPSLLRHAYHLRYELIEFAVFTLACRAQRLVPLHAACVGSGGLGVLLMGSSGAGKSTVALQCLVEGLDFLSEDSVFVAPRSLLATGVANFLHVRLDSLRWLGRSPVAAAVRRSPVIRRRSGVRKLEIDLRGGDFRLARAPLRICATVFLSSDSAGTRPLLRPLGRTALSDRLARAQPYAAGQTTWPAFSAELARLPAFELRRGRHPLESVEALRELLAARASAR